MLYPKGILVLYTKSQINYKNIIKKYNKKYNK